MPDLRDILESHGVIQKKPKKKAIRQRQARAVRHHTIHVPKPAPAESIPTKHIVLRPEDAKKLFYDLPRQHRFWLKSGKKLKNIMELYEELKIMPDDIFSHHVKDERNDFASWIKEVHKDSLLAHRLLSAETREEHLDIIAQRIDEMKNSLSKPKRRPAHIQPNLQFLKKSFNKPDKRRVIIPRSLLPDYSFIQLDKDYRSRNGADEGRSLGKQIIGLESEVDKRRDELERIERQIQAKEQEARTITERQKSSEKLAMLKSKQELMQVIHDLRQKEGALELELEELEAMEAELSSKAESIHEKELTLARKQGVVTKKKHAGAHALITKAALLTKERKYQEAKALIKEARETLSRADIPEEERKVAYYRLLEIATEADLALLR